MSPKARELKKLNDLEQLAHTDWREERDNDTEEVPEPEPERLVNLFH